MKKVLAVFLFVIFAASIASAELMTTADPVGQGSWAILGSGLSDQNVGGDSSLSMTTIGGCLGYGISEKLDTYFLLGQSTVSSGGDPITGLGINLKYTMWEESSDFPVTISAGGGYKSLSQSGTSGSQISLGTAISKVWQNFVPYGGLAYRKNSLSGSEVSSQIDLTAGSSIPWQNMGAFFVEYTLQSVTPLGGSNYSSNQIGAGFGTKL